MEDGKVERGCLERLWHSHLCTHGNAVNRFLNSSIGSSLRLFLCHSLGHSLCQHLLQHLLIHTGVHRLPHSPAHGIGDGITDRTGDSITEIDRSIGIEPLIGAEKTCGMLPAILIMRAQYKLLRQSIHLLTLFQPQEVRRHIILVHQHLIVQILIAGGRSEEQFFCFITNGNPCIEHIAFVAVHDGGGRIVGAQ